MIDMMSIRMDELLLGFLLWQCVLDGGLFHQRDLDVS